MGNTSVKQIICGIMFNDSFSILDDWGKIADSLLCSVKKAPSFPPQYFSSISQQYTISRFLSNEKKGHRLELASNNLVYTHTVQSNFEKEYKEFVSRVEKCLVPQIVEKYALIIRRIGMVYICEMDCDSISAFKQQYFAKAASEITDCRFAIRSTTPEGLAFSGIDNYILSVVLTIVVAVGGWYAKTLIDLKIECAVCENRLSAIEEDIDKLNTDQITREILNLQLDALRQELNSASALQTTELKNRIDLLERQIELLQE